MRRRPRRRDGRRLDCEFGHCCVVTRRQRTERLNCAEIYFVRQGYGTYPKSPHMRLRPRTRCITFSGMNARDLPSLPAAVRGGRVCFDGPSRRCVYATARSIVGASSRARRVRRSARSTTSLSIRVHAFRQSGGDVIGNDCCADERWNRRHPRRVQEVGVKGRPINDEDP